MSDTTAASVAAADSDEKFEELLDEAAANEPADASDNLDSEGDDLENDEANAEDTDESNADDPEKDDEAGDDDGSDDDDSEFDENHDPFDVLKEGDDDDAGDDDGDGKKKIEPIAKFKTDAKNIAKKWDDTNDEEKAEKVAKLANTRPGVLKALATELGTTEAELLKEYTDADPVKAAAVDEEALREKITKDVEARLRKEMSPDLTAAETNRFKSAVDTFAKANKLTADQIKTLTNLDGDVYKSFTETTHNPKGGQELTFNERLKLSLQSSSVNEMLIESGAIKRAKKIAAGAAAKIQKQGKAAKSAANKTADLATADDATFEKEMNSGADGVVPIKFD